MGNECAKRSCSKSVRKQNIMELKMDLIDDFPDHPFRVVDDLSMINLEESIKNNGLIVPVIVRPIKEGRYEIISGHRRKKVCEKLGYPVLRCIVMEMTDDEATIMMVESNFQRENILPSEKAFAYKMRMEAMKRRTGRHKRNEVPVGLNSSREELATKMGESQTQIHRFIRLTKLIPELLKLVDEGRIKMRPAVELSYLDKKSQRIVMNAIELNDVTPSHSQSIRLKKLFEQGLLTEELILGIMAEDKSYQNRQVVIKDQRIWSLIPKNRTAKETEDYVCKALEFYDRHLKGGGDV